MKRKLQKNLVLMACTALLPAGLSAAPSKITIGFDTDGNNEGFIGYNGSTANGITLTTAGGLISSTAGGGDPRMIKNSATPVFTKPTAVSWQSVVFRVRETNETSAVVTPFSSTGVIVALNSVNSGSGLTTAASYTPVDSGDGFFTITADVSGFTADEIRYFRVDPIGGTDAAGNLFEVDYIEVTMTNTPPALVSTSPADDGTGVAPDATLTATFDEPVFLNTMGSVTIKNLTTLTDTVISLDAPDPDGTLSVLENQLTIDPTADLGVPGDDMVIEISADAIKDADDVFYAGILSADDPNWSFTIDNVPPTPDYFHPIPGSDQAPLDGAMFIAFDEVAVIGSGNLTIYRADDTPVETINVTSLTVNGNRVTIAPTVPLASNTSYYVLIDSGAFTDALGNDYTGISDAAVWTFTTIANEPEMLFGDSFNRADGTDLDASAVGKYGSLGALSYTERLIGVGNSELSSGQLLLQSIEPNGNSGALVYLNHNFNDAAISTAGGFSVTVDLNAYITGGSGRFLAVGVGQSAAELDGQTTASASANTVADLAVGYRGTNNTLEIRKNGAGPIVTSGLPATPARMRIDYTVPDFNSGSTVDYEVFFDDSVTPFTTGSFNWSGTDENHISLSSNLFFDFITPGERNALFDNLQIRTLGSGGGSGFDTWKTTNSTAGGLDNDHDTDGVSNGVEYFIGGPNGNTTGFTALPGVTNTGGTLSVTWTHAADYTGVYDTDFVVETSATLVDPWTTETEGVNVIITDNNVTYTFPAGTKNFARLKVTGP